MAFATKAVRNAYEKRRAAAFRSAGLCTDCGRPPIPERAMCARCIKIHRLKPERAEAKRAFLQRLKEQPCVDCGGRFPHYVMEFDHVRGEKRDCIGSMYLYRTEALLAEVAKCDLVCSNCHAIRTHERRSYRVRAA